MIVSTQEHTQCFLHRWSSGSYCVTVGPLGDGYWTRSRGDHLVLVHRHPAGLTGKPNKQTGPGREIWYAIFWCTAALLA